MAPSLTNPNPKREDEREARRSLSNSDRLRVATSYHREKLPAGFEKELLEFADEWDEELEAASARPSPGDPVRAALEAVAEAAKRMPRETPAAGGAGTIHPFQIEAGVVWTLDSALTRLAALSVSTPTGEGEGWKLVPVEPTEEMIFADIGIRPGNYHYDTLASKSAHSYRLMLRAAPTSPSKSSGDVL